MAIRRSANPPLASAVVDRKGKVAGAGARRRQFILDRVGLGILQLHLWSMSRSLRSERATQSVLRSFSIPSLNRAISGSALDAVAWAWANVLLSIPSNLRR